MTTPNANRPEKIGHADLYEAFAFLDDLRESGITNMYASPAYLRDEFGCTKDESRQIFKAWTEDFSLP